MGGGVQRLIEKREREMPYFFSIFIPSLCMLTFPLKNTHQLPFILVSPSCCSHVVLCLLGPKPRWFSQNITMQGGRAQFSSTKKKLPKTMRSTSSMHCSWSSMRYNHGTSRFQLEACKLSENYDWERILLFNSNFWSKEILSKSAIGRHFYILYVCVAADLGCLQGLCISVSQYRY